MCDYPDVKVASVSYSGVTGSLRREAATHCKAQGSLMVNAAGNDSRDLTSFGDADNDDLIVAGATTSSNSKSGFSAYGTFVDVMAPGSSVRTTNIGSGYRSISGTSFSCPLTAGLIALIWSADPNYGTANELTPNEVESILKAGANPLNLVQDWNVKYGLINSRNSVAMAASGTSRVSFVLVLVWYVFVSTKSHETFILLHLFNSPRRHQLLPSQRRRRLLPFLQGRQPLLPLCLPPFHWLPQWSPPPVHRHLKAVAMV